MGSQKKPVLRLTIFFISVVLVSGSILAYLSINNISNLKELTEKRVQEEQNNLAIALQEQLEKEILELVRRFSDAADGEGLDRILGIRFLDTLELIGQIFVVDNKGNFLWPWYLEGKGKSPPLSPADAYQNTYIQAERAEFMNEDFPHAKGLYRESLTLASNTSDSVQTLNALARLSLKMADSIRALNYYSSLIISYHDLLDRNGFPYVYYAISQVLSISNLSLKDSVWEEARFFISGMETGNIPLNSSTLHILDQFKSWLQAGNDLHESSIPSEAYIRTIEKRVIFVERYNKLIKRYLSGEIYNDAPMISNRYQVLNTNSQNQGEILLACPIGEYVMGFSVPVKQLWDKISEGNPVIQADFEYKLNLVKQNHGMTGGDPQLTGSFEISRYLPGYLLTIKLKDENLIEKFIRRRSWIYGVSLLLLLGGMIFGVLLILRDISREEHVARLRADFISNVTHELKTPLTSIQLFTESMVLKRISSEENKREYLNIILKETESLKRLINNILDFSREEKGKRVYHFKEINLSSIINEAIDDIEYWLVQKNFSLVKEIEENIHAIGDPAALKQAIINILNNAVKFSVDRKEIKVRLTMEGNQILIQVEDKGIGIPEDQKDMIFQPFYRVGQKHAENISGTGLGLSVVKDIVDAHQGEIIVQSRINEGSNFIIRIKSNLENLA